MADQEARAHRDALREAVLARIDEVSARVVTMMVQDLEGYADVPPAELREAVARSLDSMLGELSDAPADDAPVGWAEEVARRRAAEGVPVESIVAAFAEGNRILWDVVLEESARLGSPLSFVLRLTLERWRQGDRVQAAVVKAHREEDFARERRSELRRRALVRRLLLPSADSPAGSVPDLADALGLPQDRDLYCVRARGVSAHELRQLCHPLVLEELDGHAVALADRPPQQPDRGTLGYEGPHRLAELPLGYAAAERAARAAWRVGRMGSYRLTDVALEVVLEEQPELGDALVTRFVLPMLGLTNGPEVLETVWQFLRAGANVDRAAAALFVHPNTVRNRLSRFEQVVDADLHDASTSVRVAWALARSSHRERQPVP